MTIEECREHLPQGWTELIQRDPVLWEIFEEHEYDLEMEAVPPFLFQDLRGGELERLRPIFALYGQPGLDMLQGLLEIDEGSRDTATSTTPTGQTAYAAYFFARFSEENRQAADDAVRAYIRAVNRVYTQELGEEAPLDEDASIEILSGKEGYDFEMQQHKEYCAHQFHPGDEVYSVLGEWFDELEYQENCQELADLLSEALYHISCDYLLSHCLCWPLLKPQRMDNPFQPCFDLWKLGLHVRFPTRDRAVLVD